MKNSAVILLLIFIFSCNNNSKTPEYVISRNDMVNIIIDMHITDGILTLNKVRKELTKKDSLNFYDAIFKNYGYTRSDFDTSIYYYSKHISEYDKIYEEVLNKLSEMETVIKEENSKEAKDSTDIKNNSVIQDEED